MVDAGAGKRLDDLANAPHMGKPAHQAEGHVRAQRQADLPQRFHRQIQLPQSIEPMQHGSRVGASAAQARPTGDTLVQVDHRALRRSRMPAQRQRRAQGQVAFILGHTGRTVGRKGYILRRLQRQGIMQGNGLHQHIQQMIAVRAHAHGIQRPVNLGVCPDQHPSPPHGAAPRGRARFPG